MTLGIRRALALGLAALATAIAAAAATIPTPLKPTSLPASAARLSTPGQEALDFDASALSALQQVSDARIENFPVAPGIQGTLVLKRFEVLVPDARVTVTGADGDSSMPFPSIAHFSGKLEGEPDSSVYVSAQQDRLVAFVRSSAAMAYVGPSEGTNAYVVRTAESPANQALAATPWSCGTEELPAGLTANAGPTYPLPLAPLTGLKQAAVRVETDQELLAKFGGDVSKMAAYVATLYGAINVIYERDLALHLAVAEVHAWTMADPYVGPTTLDQLNQLGDWWHTNRPPASYPRAMVHLVSGVSVSGGIAWVSVLCSGDFPANGSHYGGAYGVTQVYGTYPSLAFWDQLAVAHEMGHNAGSPHTHCYGPPIDMCYSGESGCYVGPTSVPPEKGTIMSYCHLIGPGYYNNVNLIFHARCISERMMPEIASATCLTQASTFLDVPPSHPFFSFVETLVANGVTSGCDISYYCPDAPVTRAQMAVLLLRSKYGPGYTPPAPTGTVFADVHKADFAAAFIEALYNEGVTGGCGTNPFIYCPGSSVTRDQMAVFLLAMKHGAGYTPPACTGVFSDVACTPNPGFAVNFVEQLRAEGVTGGCSTNPMKYCPTAPVTRGQMAVFLVTAFGLVP